MNSYLLVTLKIDEFEDKIRFDGCGPYSLLPYLKNRVADQPSQLDFTLKDEMIIINHDGQLIQLKVNSLDHYAIPTLKLTLSFQAVDESSESDPFAAKINFSESLLAELEQKKVEQQKTLLLLQNQLETSSDKLHSEELFFNRLKNDKNELELNLKKIDHEVKSKTAKLELLEDNYKKLSDKESTIKNEINRNKNILEDAKNSIEIFNNRIIDYNNTLSSLQKEISDKKHLIEVLYEEQTLLNAKIKNGENLRQSGLL